MTVSRFWTKYICLLLASNQNTTRQLAILPRIQFSVNIALNSTEATIVVYFCHYFRILWEDYNVKIVSEMFVKIGFY